MARIVVAALKKPRGETREGFGTSTAMARIILTRRRVVAH
jgi:hypothetical protein